MDRLAEQVVDWHNRHPLAKRITIYDVHTIGIVALPFMRSGSGALGSAGGQIEPVLTSEMVPAGPEGADWHEGTTVAAELHPNAAHLDALADQEAPFAKRKPLETLRALLPLLWRRKSMALWPVFSDRFIDNLSIKQVAAFADEHGYATRPGDASWPLRTIAVDDALAAAGFAGSSGAWPCELYLKSAAIDAGTSRSRVLIGRGGLRPPVLGSRCLDPKRLGAAAAVIALLIGVPVWQMWPRSEPPQAGHAQAASAPRPASAPMVHPVTPIAAASAASMPEAAASAAALAEAASTPASVPAAMPAASEAAPPDIRPQILPLQGGRTRGGKPITDAPPIGRPASMPAAATHEEQPAAKPAAETATPMVPKAAVVVALVGPPSRDKADAEKLLALMLELAQPSLPSPSLMASMPVPSSVLPVQSQVFLTPEGWRPALYPFSSREQAQLINANLVAHGLKTKAVNF